MLAFVNARRVVDAALVLVVISLGSGCPHSHDHAPAGGGGEAEPAVESHTVYTDQVEHFDEHPPLVAGQPAKFAAHATDIRSDFKAVREGTMVVVALRDGAVVARSEPTKPRKAGIFGPVLTVPTAGPVEIRIRLETPQFTDEASLGEVVVHATEEAAAKAAAEAEKAAAAAGGGVEPIAFLKEQAWRIEFRNEPVGRRRLVETLRVPGRVVPRPDGRAIIAAPAAGRLVPPSDGGFAKLGERVEADALLATVVPVLGGAEGTQLIAARAELTVKAAQVEIEIERARSRVARAEKLLERAERLRKSGAGSERELEDARFEAELARADLAAAEKLRDPYQAVARAQEGGGATLAVPCRTPMAGTIAIARVTPGEYVEAGRVLFEVLDLSTVWVEADVPEPDLGRLAERPAASVVPAAVPGAPARAEGVSFVALAPAIEEATRSARIVYRLDRPGAALRPGAAVDVLIETARAEEALAVPESAIVDEDGRPVVFVQVEGEAFERRDVRLGIASGGYVQVLERRHPEERHDGVLEGERVVTKGAYAVRLQSVSTTLPAHGHAH